MLKAWLGVVLLAALAWPVRAEDKAPSRVVLDGVDYYRVVDPNVESVRVVLSYRGEKYSPAYVQGISGNAFKVAGPCPCAPTSWGSMPPVQLARLLGYRAEEIYVGGPYGNPGLTPPADVRKRNMQDALVEIKRGIRAGRPAILVHAFTYWEWDVVCGFDDATHELYGRGSYEAMRKPEYTHADELRALGAADIGGGPYVLLIEEKSATFDAKAAELAALKGAVTHAHTQATGKGLPMGLECYDLWIDQYRHQGSHMAPKGPAPDTYPLSILPSTRRAAAQFLAELAAKYPAAKAHLELGSDDFAAEAEALGAAAKLRGSFKEEASEEQCAQMAGLLSRARAMYALAIDEIRYALPQMEVSK